MTSVTFDEIKRDRLIAARWLLLVAWLVEFCAAATGIYFAFIQGDIAAEFMKQTTAGSVGNIMGSPEQNAMLARLPFFIVGMVELTKIPLAYAVYHSRIFIWRSIFLGTLMILCFLTFETILAGLERSNNNQTLPMLDLKAEQKELSDELIFLTTRRDDIQQINTDRVDKEYNDIEADAYAVFEGQLGEAERTRKDEIDQITSLEAEQTEAYRKSASTSEEALQQQLTDRKNDLSNLYIKIEGEQQNIRESAGRDLQFQNDILSSLDNQLENARTTVNSGLLGGPSRRDFELEKQELTAKQGVAIEAIKVIQENEQVNIQAISDDNDKTIVNLNNRIQNIEQQITGKSENSEQIFNDIMANLNGRMININQRADEERKRYADQYNASKKIRATTYEQQIKDLNDKRANLPKIEQSLSLTQDRLIIIKKDVSRIANQVNIIRFAKIWNGLDSAADVTKDMERDVILIWFGSIALIASITGTVIAFASFLLQDRDAFTPKQKKTPRRVISNALRGLILRRRKFYRNKTRGVFTYLMDSIGEAFQALKNRLLRPVVRKEYIEKEVEKIVEVTKEIPVEKVVTVTKEVPKEIIRKEMVYVPFYSSEGGTLDISGEIKDLTSAEDIKKKIKEITQSMTTKKPKNEDWNE